MTQTGLEPVMLNGGSAIPVMVQASRSGSEVPADVASRALILMGERYPKAYRECLGDALLGDV